MKKSYNRYILYHSSDGARRDIREEGVQQVNTSWKIRTSRVLLSLEGESKGLLILPFAHVL